MILLDTNYLIRLLVSGSKEAQQVDLWVEEQRPLCTFSICWYEFASGPVDTEGIEIVYALLDAGILPFDVTAATEASRLFSRTGRNRGLRVNAMIAAAAITAGARLATGNEADFRVFAPQGLELV